MARWALALKRRTEWQPLIHLDAGFMDRHMDSPRAEGIEILSFPESEPRGVISSGDGENAATRGRLRAAIRGVPGLRAGAQLSRQLLAPAQIPGRISELRQRVRSFEQVLRGNSIDAVVLAESSPDYGAPALIDAAHRQNIPVVVAPIEQTRAHHVAENYREASHLKLKRPFNRLAAAFYPRWVLAHRGQDMVRMEAGQLLAMEWAGLAPPHPWQIVGNREDAIAVDSDITKNVYFTEGVASDRMTVTGGPEHDMLADLLPHALEKREQLYQRLGLPPNRPMLLSPLVQEHFVTGRSECDFQDLDSMVKFWVQTLGSARGYNVIINLHPSHSYRRDPSTWNYLEQWGVKICGDDLSALVPLCDIYVAAGSTTIPWAIACGKPVINYDVYRYGTAVYASALGVLPVQEQRDFVAVLNRLTTDPAYYEEVAGLQRSCAPHWGVLDGGAAKRLAALCDRLVAHAR